MALIVEDGTSLEDADSYISVSYADTHHATRGSSLWEALTVSEKEQSIRRATDYLVDEYRSRWLGHRTLTTQALDWPRTNVIIKDMLDGVALPITFVPNDIRRACAEMALKAAAGELVADTERSIIEETVGPITTKWDPKSPQNKKYPQIDRMLKMYMSDSDNGFVTKLVRC